MTSLLPGAAAGALGRPAPPRHPRFAASATKSSLGLSLLREGKDLLKAAAVAYLVIPLRRSLPGSKRAAAFVMNASGHPSALRRTIAGKAPVLVAAGK